MGYLDEYKKSYGISDKYGGMEPPGKIKGIDHGATSKPKIDIDATKGLGIATAALGALSSSITGGIGIYDSLKANNVNAVNKGLSTINNNVYTGQSVADAYNQIGQKQYKVNKKDFLRSGSQMTSNILGQAASYGSLGAAIGSIFPGAGTVIGAAAGTALGSIIGGIQEGVGKHKGEENYLAAKNTIGGAQGFASRNDDNLAYNANINNILKPKDYNQTVNISAQGGSLHHFQEGQTYDLDERTIQELKKKGYVIQHLE